MVPHRMARRIYFGAMVLSVAFLSFLAGVTVTGLQTGPYPALRRYLAAAHALRNAWPRPGPDSAYFYGHARSTKTGVVRHDPQRAFSGYTLFTSGHGQKAYLVDMQGAIVHEWLVPFYQAWPDPPHITSHRPAPERVSVHATHLDREGDLIALYEEGGGTPWGCGLVKMDYRSRILWSYPERVHHDVHVARDGRIYTLAHQVVTERLPGLPAHAQPPILEDYLVVLSAQGTELDRIGLTDAMRRSAYEPLLRTLRPNLAGDLWHANSVDVLEADRSDRFPDLRQGQVLLSIRNVDALAVVDLPTRSVVWAARGPWRQQHDAQFLASGTILLFDNRGPSGPGCSSRVLEIDPASAGIAWQYQGTPEEPFRSDFRGSQQRLPNGNTLICETQAGRIFEVTRTGEIVWEYLSPFRAPGAPLRVGNVYGAVRFAADSLSFPLSGRLHDG